MKVVFQGGPWNGVKVDLPTIPERVVLSRREWTARSGDSRHNVEEAMVLMDWVDYIYSYRQVETAGRYELQLIEEP